MSEPVVRKLMEEIVANDEDTTQSRMSHINRNYLIVKRAMEYLAVAPLQQETDKDGERYRYLRDEETGDWIADRLTLRLPEDWDAFIDERMSAALPQKDGMK